MNPVITNKQTNHGELSFTLGNINLSYVNGIRRTLLSEIPTVVMKTMSYENNDCIINKNTSRYNNEILKQRLSCIPIHISDLSINLKNLLVILNYKNESSELEYVTTEHFKIIDKTTDKEIPESEVRKIFPKNSLTKHGIDIVALRPSFMQNPQVKTNGEEISLECKLSIACAKENSMFNVVSKSSFGNTLMPKEFLEEKYEKYEKELLTKEKYNTNELEILRNDWFAVDAKRFFLENSYDFKIQTIGVFKNEDLIKIACGIMIKKLMNLLHKEEDEKDGINMKYNLEKNEEFAKNCFDLILFEEDYTIGKILEHLLYKNNVEGDKSLVFVSFIKKHPHQKGCIIRIITTSDDILYDTLIDQLHIQFEEGIETLKNIVKLFN